MRAYLLSMSLLTRFQVWVSVSAGKLSLRYILALFVAVVLTNCSIPRMDIDSTPANTSPQEAAVFECEMTYRGGTGPMCPGAELTRMSDGVVVAQSTRVGGILEGRKDIRKVTLLPGYYSVEIETCPPLELWYSVYTTYCFYAKPGFRYLVRQEFPEDWSKGCWKLWIEEYETKKRFAESPTCLTLKSEARFKELEERAKASQPDRDPQELAQVEAANAKYESASRIKDKSKAWRLICSAAHEGSREARFALASHYSWGRAPVSKDYVRSYVWYTLAANAGHTPALRALAFLENQMTALQIAEAERIATEWEPNPRICDVGARNFGD